jgi:hypothetical protein
MRTISGSCAWGGFLTLAIILGLATALSASAGPRVYSGANSYSSFLVDGAGSLVAWGDNGYGNLGIGGNANQLTPVAAPSPTGVHGWRAIAPASSFAMGNYTYAIGADGLLYVAGFAGFGLPSNYYFAQVTPFAGINGWTSVAASSVGWLAVATNGYIYGSINGTVTWAPRPGATRWTQVALGSYFQPNELDIHALDDRGKIFGVYSGTAWFPSPTFTEIPVPSGATAWTNVVAGRFFVLAQANNGNLYGWRRNESGQLGTGSSFTLTNTPQLVPLPAGKTGWGLIAAGGSHVLATTTDGQLYVWGSASHGQLGLGDTSPNRTSPTPVPNLTNVTAIAAGYRHSLVVANCETIVWGHNSIGSLGLGFTSPYYPLPIAAQLTYDICDTNPPPLPVVSITAPDPNASQGTWLSTLGAPATNTGRFEISRAVAAATSLNVNVSIAGTASNGVDYLALPTYVTIPANSNAASLLVVPTGSNLAFDPSTIVVSVLPDANYQLGNTTNATVMLIQYEAEPGGPPVPDFKLHLFVGTNLAGQVFTIQASTNLIDWAEIGTGTNIFGVVTVSETNRTRFRQRFFRAFPVSEQ